MLDVAQFRSLIVRPTLQDVGMYSQAAENLMVGTAIQESRLRYLRQLGDGPAFGLYQMEEPTFDDTYGRYLGSRADLKAKIDRYLAPAPKPFYQMVSNLAFATAVARTKYWMDPNPLPGADDLQGLADTWKRVYNTPQGAGTATEWLQNYQEYGVAED